MARVDSVAWLKSQVATLRKAHNDAATSLANLITGQAKSLSPGVWAPAAQGIQTPPAGAAGWFTINAFAGSGWSSISGSARPAVMLLPANMVVFVGTMNCGTLTNGTKILNTLPSWAIPQNAGCRIPLSCDGGATAAGYLTVSLTGDVACRDMPAGTSTAGWCVHLPLENPAAP